MVNTYCPIFTLDENSITLKILNYPAFDKGAFGNLDPYVALARKVILALDSLHSIVTSPHVISLDE